MLTSSPKRRHAFGGPIAIKAFLISAVLELPFFVMMLFGHSRLLEVVGRLFFVPSIYLLERLPARFHFCRPTRQSSALCDLMEVAGLEFVIVGTLIFTLAAATTRFSSELKSKGQDDEHWVGHKVVHKNRT